MDKYDPQLTAFVMGELPEHERKVIQSAIDDSPELAQSVAEIQATIAAVSSAFAGETVSGLEPGLDASDLSVPRSLKAPAATVHAGPNRFLHWVAACSVVFLAIMIAALLINLNGERGPVLSGGSEMMASLDTSQPPVLEQPAPAANENTAEKEIEELLEADYWESSEHPPIKAFVPNLSLLVSPNDEEVTTEAEVAGDAQGQSAYPPVTQWHNSNGQPQLVDALDAVGNTISSTRAGLESRSGDTLQFEMASRRAFGVPERNDDPFGGGKSGESFSDLTTESLALHDRRGELHPGPSASISRELDEDTAEDYLSSAGQADSAGTEAPENQLPQRPSVALSKDRILSSGDGEAVDGQMPGAEQQRMQRQLALQRFAKPHPDASQSSGESLERDEHNQLQSMIVQTIVPDLWSERVDPSGTREISIDAFDLSGKRLRDQIWDLQQEKRLELRDEDLQAVVGARDAQDTDDLSRRLRREIEASIVQKLEQYNQNVRKRRSWKRVKATGNTSRLIVGEKDELEMTGMQTHVQVDGFRARVLIDYFYYNDRNRQLEGTFKLRLPDDASLYYFAFGESTYDFSPKDPLVKREFVDGNDHYVSLRPADIGLARQDAWTKVKEARMVPREKAAFAYSQTVRRRVDPALVEWSGAGVFNARVFPLAPQKLHRIVVGYDVNLAATDAGAVYSLDLPEQTGQCRVDLSVSELENVRWQLDLHNESDPTTDASTSSWQANKTAGNGKSQRQMRFDQPEWRSLQLTAIDQPTMLLTSGGADPGGSFFATRIQATLPKDKQTTSPRAIFLLDTSLSSRPDKFNVWLDLMRATLENNRDSLKEFSVLFFDVDHRFWRPKFVDNSDENVRALMADCFQLGLEGATDLHGALKTLHETTWIKNENENPDLFLLSDGAANWGETNLHLLKNALRASNTGSLFAYQTGLTGTAISQLRFLAGSTGGAVFSVASEDEIARASTAHRNRPWQLISVEWDGASDLMTAGRVQWVYPDQTLTVVGRGQATGQLILNMKQGSDAKQLKFSVARSLESETAARLYGQVAVNQLESLGQELFDVSAAYARHFRITGNTCSLLMLESEADYKRFDIKPQDDQFVVLSKNASEIVATTLAQNATELADPKSQLLSWIDRLESMPGLKFTMPTALQLAIVDMEIEAVDGRLHCQARNRETWSKKYTESLESENLDPVVVAMEAENRRAISVDDTIKVLSSLVENHPGDWVLARDVAFSAMKHDRPGSAYHLLRRVIDHRPYEGSTYAAIGQCLTQLGKADMAMVFYELALGCHFQNQGADFRRIVATEYASLLRRIESQELSTAVPVFAKARRQSLKAYRIPEKCDLIVALMWNTDQTDVDLHVVEPSGEECNYQNRSTQSGGKMTTDIQAGFGPEMYVIPTAPSGQYDIKVKYYGSGQSRTNITNKAYLTIYRNYGSKNENLIRQSITLQHIGQKESVHLLDIQ